MVDVKQQTRSKIVRQTYALRLDMVASLVELRWCYWLYHPDLKPCGAKTNWRKGFQKKTCFGQTIYKDSKCSLRRNSELCSASYKQVYMFAFGSSELGCHWRFWLFSLAVLAIERFWWVMEWWWKAFQELWLDAYKNKNHSCSICSIKSIERSQCLLR